MAKEIATSLQARLKLLVARDSTFNEIELDKLFNLDQTSEEYHYTRFKVDGAVADQAIDFGKVNSPTFIFIQWSSTDPDATPVDDPLNVTVKIDSAAAGSVMHSLLLDVQDPLLDLLTKDITFSTEAGTSTNSETEVTVLIMGRKS